MKAAVALLCLCFGSLLAAADAPPAGSADDASSVAARDNPLLSIPWEQGPVEGGLGEHARIQVPEGFVFTGAQGTKRFQEITQNPTSGREAGLLLPTGEEDGGGDWFVVFEFDPVGYVKDDEKSALDADALLKGIRAGTAEANKLRRERGWEELEIVGWERPPFYDPQTHNLTWAIRGRTPSGEVVNWSTRLLGRHGVMNVDLVLGPERLAAVLPRFQSLLQGFDYKEGSRYAEFHAGDKVAAYGLTALVAGGAGAIAAKTGLLAKFWKLIVGGVVALGALLRKLFGRKPAPTGGDATPIG